MVSDERYLRKRFVKKLGYEPNFDNPVTFNEKVTARMIFERNSMHTALADKVAVRDLVLDKIGSRHVVPLIGIYKKFSDIDFNKLPNQFVLKCSHDSGSATICEDIANFNFKKIDKKINNCLKLNMYYRKREWHYKNIQPQILIEKYVPLYIDAGSLAKLTACRVHCFEGRAQYIEVDVSGADGKEYSNIYDPLWNIQPFTVDLKNNIPHKIVEPPQFKTMLNLSEKLCFKQGYSRVDFLLSVDDVFFSEITLTPNAGRMVITPTDWDKKLGELWQTR